MIRPPSNASPAGARAAGRIDEVIADLKAQATCLPTDRRDGLKAAVRYLTSHRAFLRYDQALEQGWPIATGVVEGTARYLVGDRLEIAGARWDWPEPRPS